MKLRTGQRVTQSLAKTQRQKCSIRKSIRIEFHHNFEATTNLEFSGFTFQLNHQIFSVQFLQKCCSVLILSPGTVKLDTLERSLGSDCGSPRPLVQQRDLAKVVRGPKLADLSQKWAFWQKPLSLPLGLPLPLLGTESHLPTLPWWWRTRPLGRPANTINSYGFSEYVA